MTELFKAKGLHVVGDESVGSFISRRLSPAVANNLVSAGFHGIYAGDINQLSMRMILPVAYEYERRFGTLGEAFLHINSTKSVLRRERSLLTQQVFEASPLDPALKSSFDSAAVYTFQNGAQQLVDRLVKRLRANPNITIRTSCGEIDLLPHANDRMSISPRLPKRLRDPNSPADAEDPAIVASRTIHSHVISTISPKALVGAARTTFTLGLRGAQSHAVTVFYPGSSITVPPGFGYLIPAGVPFDQNPERALGVIFDSSYSGHPSEPASSTDQPPTPAQDTAPGTKLTVMLGGYYWDGWTEYPSETEALELATSLLQRHLGIHTPPTAWHVALQHSCIPQYTVGHVGRLAKAHRTLQTAFAGRVRVTGSWWNGVGVNDCVTGAWEVVQGLRQPGLTGLEDLVRKEGEGWVEVGARRRKKKKKEEGGSGESREGKDD
jgi:protoporphyrinogen oxidase